MLFGWGRKNRRHQPAQMENEEWTGHIEPGVELEGTLKISTPEGLFRLNSHFKGHIASEGKLVVAEQGDVEAEISGRMVSIYGKVKGTVRAFERLEIMEHGIVLGDIYTPCLVIDPGGYFDGQCHMPTPEPAKQITHDVDSKDHP